MSIVAAFTKLSNAIDAALLQARLDVSEVAQQAHDESIATLRSAHQQRHDLIVALMAFCEAYEKSESADAAYRLAIDALVKAGVQRT